MSRSSKERSLERDFTRFPGYGDRVGSGVEFAPTFWTGGELVTDPHLVNKSLKPRRMYYSPIGDGVVAADGIELKRIPRDQTPRVSVIHQRVVERGAGGRDGVRVMEKTWTTGGDGESQAGVTRAESEIGGGFPDSGRNSRATNVTSPFSAMGDPLGFSGAPSGPGVGSAPLSGLKSPAQNPYGTFPKAESLNGLGDSRYDFPQSGRTSTTSALFSEPGMRYEIKKDYLVTNPKELIHQYATTTPVQTIDGYESLPGGGTITRTIKQQYSKSTTEETYAPYAPYHAGANSVNPSKFVRQVRDEGLTNRQHQANQNQTSFVQGDLNADRKVQQIRQQTTMRGRAVPDVDNLTDRLITGLHTGHPTPPRF
ncbi:hypothetical protein FO519_002292 [Halicephalobus sp. NKZ332]|nr:hypothetical protein FO519_002292 [Halicephalobus sp. NKZ332]